MDANSALDMFYDFQNGYKRFNDIPVENEIEYYNACLLLEQNSSKVSAFKEAFLALPNLINKEWDVYFRYLAFEKVESVSDAGKQYLERYDEIVRLLNESVQAKSPSLDNSMQRQLAVNTFTYYLGSASHYLNEIGQSGQFSKEIMSGLLIKFRDINFFPSDEEKNKFLTSLSSANYQEWRFNNYYQAGIPQ